MIKYCNVNFSKVLAIKRKAFHLVKKKNWYSIIRCYKWMYRTRSPERKSVSPESRVVAFKSMVRKDYEMLFYSYIYGLESVRVFDFAEYSSYRLSPRKFLLCVFLFFYLRAKIPNWKYRFLVIGDIAEAQLWCREVDKCNPELVIVFSDMQLYDNYIAQYFRSAGLKTITLQHALYIDFKEQENINVVNYKNVVSEYFFAWGENTAKIIEKHCSKVKTVIVGNPLIEAPQLINGSDVLIVLDHPLYIKENLELLEILNKVQISEICEGDVYIKFHPGDSLSNYQQCSFEAYEILNTLNQRVFSEVVGHTSTLLYIRGCQGERVLRYKSGISAIEEGYEFSTEESFLLGFNGKSLGRIEVKNMVLYCKEESSNSFNRSICEVLDS